jgi:hypothetical protein
MEILGILTAFGVYTSHCMAFLCLVAANSRVLLPGPLMAETASEAPWTMAMHKDDAGE